MKWRKRNEAELIGLVVGVVLLVVVVAFLCWCAYDIGYDRGWAYRPPRLGEHEEIGGSEGDDNEG